MKDATAELAKKTAQKKDTDRKVAIEATALDRRYGKIGIPAVAAAARYQSSTKGPAAAPVSSKWRDHFAEAAA
jgi:hypothetical protein